MNTVSRQAGSMVARAESMSATREQIVGGGDAIARGAMSSERLGSLTPLLDQRHQFLFALVDGGGNVPPELAAARRLRARGHAVTVIADDSVASDVHSTGAELRRWVRAPNRPDRRPENDPVRDWECRYPWQLLDRLMRTLLVGPARRYADDVQDALAERRPAAVICSMFCLGGMVAAEAAGIPFVVLFPNIYPLPVPGMPPFGIGLRPARGLSGRLRDRALNAIIERQWDAKGLKGLNALRVGQGLPPLAHVFDQVRRARRQLVMTSPALDFHAALPSGVRYVGPVLDDPQWSETASWTPPAGDAPLALVAMSSTFQDQIGSLQCVIDALGMLPVRALVTAGPALDVAALRPASNVTVTASAPHRQVLRHTAVVITHGGHGTVVKALAAGVPVVMLPHGRDQADMAVRVSARGAGMTLTRSARPDAIAAAVRRVLENPSYRAAAQRLGKMIRQDAASDLLVRELEATAARCGHDTTPVEPTKWIESVVRRLLWLDCIAAALGGLTVLALNGWLGRGYALPRNVLLFIGTVNLLYACYSFSLAVRTRRPMPLIKLLVLANSAWAAVCLGLAAAFWEQATLFGVGHLVGEAIFVGGLAGSEWRWRTQLLSAGTS